ncbi:MAG: DNA mismatch repair endonuclease MutL [Chloroflexi bacterium]|nr:DNA mismatch repair endonuclease MutL [Chloroflexota bacterium]
MSIHLLGNDLIGKIAAGEVVERPAAAVKELIENALDAGASQIEIELRAGGIALIRVSDDGDGIPAGELELAVTRHATSKIATDRDLTHIETLGFRGEALAAIAAVTTMTLVSRPPGAVAGAFVSLYGGDVVERGVQGSPVGTTVFARDLFKTVPARLAFLRSPTAEAGRVANVVGLYALAFPHVAFRLLTDGRLAFHSPGAGNRRDVLVELWGADTAERLIDLGDTTVGATTVSGFASPLDLTRGRRDAQMCFVNHRWVDSRVLTYSIADAYREYVQRGRHPYVALFVSVPSSAVDVNVHPAKAEVRFLREGEVFAAVQRSFRLSLGDAQRLFGGGDGTGSGWAVGPVPTQIPMAPAGSEIELVTPPNMLAPANRTNDGGVPQRARSAVPMRSIGQVGTTYIVTEGLDGMYLLDQHAAHERLVFDELLGAAIDQPRPGQGLLNPAPIVLSSRQTDALATLGGVLRSYGFEWEPFGDDTILLRSLGSARGRGDRHPARGSRRTRQWRRCPRARCRCG